MASSPPPGEPPGLDFEAVYQAHFHELQRWALYLGAPAADVDDITQKVFLIVLQRRGDFRGGDPRPWLCGITRKVVASHRRLAWFRRIFQPAPEAPELLAPAAADEDTLDRKRIVERALAGMSDKLRFAFILHEIEGYTLEEMAALLGISGNTAASRLRLARQRFAELSREEEGP